MYARGPSCLLCECGTSQAYRAQERRADESLAVCAPRPGSKRPGHPESLATSDISLNSMLNQAGCGFWLLSFSLHFQWVCTVVVSLASSCGSFLSSKRVLVISLLLLHLQVFDCLFWFCIDSKLTFILHYRTLTLYFSFFLHRSVLADFWDN